MLLEKHWLLLAINGTGSLNTGHYAVILINSNGEHAVVRDASFKEIKWNVIRLKTDNFPIERELSSLNEVFKFLNENFESLK